MPRPRKASRWSHPLYRTGYCFERYGNVYTRVGNVKEATGLVWHEKNRKAALAILEKRVLAYLNPVVQSAEVRISAAVVEYGPVIKQYSRSTQHQYRRAFELLLPNDCSLTDIDRIRMMIRSGLDAYKAENNTKRQLLMRVHTFFEFCSRQGWCTVNPAKMVVKPKFERADVNPFTRSEIMQIIAHNREAGNDEFALLIEFLGQTAMRIGETLKLRWCDIDERKIVVDGKGGIEREIPIETFPRLIEVLRELRALNDADVFRWNTMPILQRTLKATCEALAIQPRGFHAIRKMRENEWIDDEGLPPHLAAYLCGHSVAVQEKNYRTKPRAAELVKLLKSVKGDNQGTNGKANKQTE
jgi:integrase